MGVPGRCVRGIEAPDADHPISARAERIEQQADQGLLVDGVAVVALRRCGAPHVSLGAWTGGIVHGRANDLAAPAAQRAASSSASTVLPAASGPSSATRTGWPTRTASTRSARRPRSPARSRGHRANVARTGHAPLSTQVPVTTGTPRGSAAPARPSGPSYFDRNWISPSGVRRFPGVFGLRPDSRVMRTWLNARGSCLRVLCAPT